MITIDIVSIPKVGRTTFIQSIGKNYSAHRRQEFTSDYERGVIYHGCNLDDFTSTENRRVLLLFDINDEDSYIKLHDLAHDLKNKGTLCVAFANKDDIHDQPFDFRMSDETPLDIPMFLGSAKTGKNTSKCVDYLLSL